MPTGLPHLAIVTGVLAEPAARRVAEQVRAEQLADITIITLNIQVAALMTADWVARKLELPAGHDFERVILTGYCRGDVSLISDKLGVPVELGPRHIQELPAYLAGRKHGRTAGDYRGDDEPYDIEIIAEINDAARLPLETLLAVAEHYKRDGADVIDLGCDPQTDRPVWSEVGATVKELRDRGHRVSVDSFHPKDVEAACAAGAELVLSVNSHNAANARDCGAEVVAIPDRPNDLASLYCTLEILEKHDVRYRVDPIIEPLGFGFARSLGRYLAFRDAHPDTPMMMGIGNLSEMTEVDSAGVNMLLIGFCQELSIRSVLTTQVINWSRSAVREIDIARRIMRFALAHGMPPKHIDERLVTLRDDKVYPLAEEFAAQLASRLKDRNVRILADVERQCIHAMHKGAHAIGDDPFELFRQLGIEDPSHAFYLGYEMAKAVTALTLGKRYEQDQPLDWGFLTRAEVSHHESGRKRRRKPNDG